MLRQPSGPRMRSTRAASFDLKLLRTTRIFASASLPIPEVPFRRFVERLGLSVPSAATIAAITFDDVVAVRDELTLRLLFHELVHVVQYRQLGVHSFARQYVSGFLSQGSYEDIPLEQCAYVLEERFARGTGAFRVEFEVRKWLARDGFTAGPLG